MGIKMNIVGNNLLNKIAAIRIIIFITVIAALTVFTNTAFCQDCKKAIPIFQGEYAGCTGILYPENLVKEHLRLKIESKEMSQKYVLNNIMWKDKLSICTDHLNEADKQLKKQRNRPFWKTPAFGFVSGAVFTVFLLSVSLD